MLWAASVKRQSPAGLTMLWAKPGFRHHARPTAPKPPDPWIICRGERTPHTVGHVPTSHHPRTEGLPIPQLTAKEPLHQRVAQPHARHKSRVATPRGPPNLPIHTELVGCLATTQNFEGGTSMPLYKYREPLCQSQ